jgi:hypothetical protein
MPRNSITSICPCLPQLLPNHHQVNPTPLTSLTTNSSSTWLVNVEDLPLAGLPPPPQSPQPLRPSAPLRLLLILPSRRMHHHQPSRRLRPLHHRDLVSSDKWHLPLRKYTTWHSRAPLGASNMHYIEHATDILQWCRSRILHRPRSRRLVWRWLFRARRGHSPKHRIRIATPEHLADGRPVIWPVRDRRQQLPQVHG